MMFFANPYDTSAEGFYFDSYSSYEEQSDALRNSMGLPVEEFEIDVIDGTQEEVQLATAMGVNQGNLSECLEVLEGDEANWPALFFLLDNGIVTTLNEALDKVDEVCLTESTLLEAATKLFDECYGSDIPEQVRFYIDYESFARDCKIGGDMAEFEFGNTTYTCTNVSCL